jgi:phosphonate ABC transporter permease subunit PhnE
MKSNKPSPWKSVQIGLAVLLVMVVYAYGFEITNIDLQELQSERRQTSLVRVTRALAQPDIFEFEQEEMAVTAPVYVTCPPDGVTLVDPPASGAYISVTPACAEPGETVSVEGFNFPPNTSGPVRFVPGNDPTNPVQLGRDTAQTDSEGHFLIELELPNRPSEDEQFIRATMRRSVGVPQFSQTAKNTWAKIIETVFLALLATTLGTVLAIPLSFIAARNLMRSVKSPLASIALSVLGWPVGMALGFIVVRWVSTLSAPLASSILANVASVVVSPIALLVAMRWALPQEEITPPSSTLRATRLLVLLIAMLVGFYGLFQLAALASNLGARLSETLGSFGFLGNFLFQLGEILRITTPALGALAAGGTVSNAFGRFGQRVAETVPAGGVKAFNLVTSAAAGATIFGLVGALIEWLYQIGRPEYTFWGPVVVGASLGLLLALFTKPKDTLPIGMIIYYVTRTILNALRSVEALVMAIVFVIAVGIGPFAGVMALGLHTIVSLAKLYSEQVESISPGPLEAVEATGANRLQTIIYAVVPQIIPPYISYTMYRWDINVRMSTIIGFVGGGGIGFLLQQNINLLNYRAASTQMLAIAVVVASMDYISSVLREKYV